MERLISVKELAQVIGLSPATIYTLVERREIPVQRVRRRVMFAPSAIERWLARQAHPDRDTYRENLPGARTLAAGMEG